MARSKSKKPYKKILLTFLAVILGGGALFLFINGVLSILSYIPIVNKSPEIDVIAPVAQGANVNDIRERLSDKNIIVDTIFESSGSAVIIAKLKDGPSVYFSKVKDSLYQVNSLQLILSKLTIDNKKPSLVDLRRDRPIVKF